MRHLVCVQRGRGFLNVATKMLPVLLLTSCSFFRLSKLTVWDLNMERNFDWVAVPRLKSIDTAGSAKRAFEFPWRDVGGDFWHPKPEASDPRSGERASVPRGARSGQLGAIRTAEGDLTSLCLAVRMTP